MDTQVKELIETIKAEGVQSAEKQAQQIVAAAEEKAQEITNNARTEAASIVEEAKSDRARQESAGKEAVRQAARDLILSVQSQLTSIFREVVERSTAETLSDSVLEQAIVTVVQSWASGSGEELDVMLSQGDLENLESTLRSRLSSELASGTEIKASPAVKGGFRIATRDGSIYYDFTTDAIAEALSSYVTPRLAQSIREAAQGA